MTAVDLSPIINGIVFPILGVILTALAGWALVKVAAYAHFQVQDGQRQLVANVITSAIAYAEKTLGPHETVSTSATVATALNYIIPKVPDALKGLGIDPNTTAGQQHLADIITAKLPA